MNETQATAILALLRERGDRGVTPLEALRIVGSLRLGARIFDLRRELRKEGRYDITTTMEQRGEARVACYRLIALAPRRTVVTGEQQALDLAS